MLMFHDVLDSEKWFFNPVYPSVPVVVVIVVCRQNNFRMNLQIKIRIGTLYQVC